MNGAKLVEKIQKRDGSIVPFDQEKIVAAVDKAMTAAHEGTKDDARVVAERVRKDLVEVAKKEGDFVPTVEGIQDMVEKELINGAFAQAAKAFILYREARAKLRQKGVSVPPEVKHLAEESKKYFRNPLGEFVYYRSYSRWIDSEQRRETWIETVDRYMSFMKENLGSALDEGEYGEIREGILSHKAMPSMRLLQFAGPAARKTNVCAYNCSFIAPENFQDLSEIMHISMCGTGVGFSVESSNVQKFPQIMHQTGEKLPVYVIPDSKEGWADSLSYGMKAWAEGKDVEFDFGALRPAGASLKTMGGKASGPEPLKRLLKFTRERMLARQGRRLRNIDVHDIICMIGDTNIESHHRRQGRTQHGCLTVQQQ